MKTKAIKVHCEDCANFQDSFFCHCSKDELDTLFEQKMCNHFKKGQIIFFEGNYPLGLHCIKTGLVKIYKTGSEGKELILRISKPGEFLGYRALVADENYSATAETLEETTTCFITREEFSRLLEQNKILAKKMTKSLCQDLGIAHERTINLSQKNARERVAETLYLLYSKFANAPNSIMPQVPIYIGIQLPREDIANLANTTTETTIRLLTEFKEEGVIGMNGKKIMVSNPMLLKKIARV